MRVVISFDMEGVAGIVDWDQCRAGEPGYAEGRELLLGEVNAAIDGARDAGADDVVCTDAHGLMHNLPPDRLHGQARYVAGRHKPGYMMEGVDGEAGAVAYVGYHGAISGGPAVLSHTYNPAVIAGARLNGVEVGEGGINALVAAGHGVPVVFVSGDRAAVDDTIRWSPEVEGVVVKESITRFAAASLHPERARAAIRAGVAAGVARADAIGAPRIDLPARLEVDVQTADMAEVAAWIKGVERAGVRTVAIESTDPLAVFHAFVGLTYITRVAEGR